MKIYISLYISVLLGCFSAPAQRSYVGSTPAHEVVRTFLQISQSDSIDFIRWKLVLGSSRYELQCRYGISKGGTPGFINEKEVTFEGDYIKAENRLSLEHNDKSLSIVEVNGDLLHLLGRDKLMLAGNGGYSYALNNTAPLNTAQFNVKSVQKTTKSPLVFEGRTPCQELSSILSLNKGDACNKLKWYFIFYSDSITGRPSYYLSGGMGYRKETMERGTWQIIKNKDGQIIYQIRSSERNFTLNLLKGDDNILFFIRPDGRLLVGNEDFSYTLNRRTEEYPPVIR